MRELKSIIGLTLPIITVLVILMFAFILVSQLKIQFNFTLFFVLLIVTIMISFLALKLLNHRF